mgnify:CR=1 FL=1
MSELPRVRVVNPNDGWLGTECYIDEKKIDRVKRIDFSIGVEKVPTFVFETTGIPDIDMLGEIQFSFAPKTIEEAKKIIEHESRKHKIELKISKRPACIVPYIDGEYIPFCKGIDGEHDLDSKVENIKFDPIENAIETALESKNIDLSEYAKFACIVLRNELLKHEDLYDGFSASISSALKEHWCCGMPFESEEKVAKKILNHVIGGENEEEK